MANVIEESKSSRATCRSCRQKIEKGVLRFGEEIPNAFDPEGGPSYAWHHLSCAAKKKANLVKPALDAYPGEVPDREGLQKLLDSAAPPEAKDRTFPYADYAPTSRARCIACEEPIEKGTLRVAIEREVNTGAFTTKGPGYLHPACAPEHVGDDALLEKVRANSIGLSDAEFGALAQAFGG